MNINYYAIVPANVRYDKTLKDKAKLLYGELTALSNEKGYCWANNSYFAELYGVSKETISRLISNLSEKGYINVEIIYDGKQVKERRIYIVKDQHLLMEKSRGVDENINTPIDENVNTPIDVFVKDNNTSFNNTSFNNTTITTKDSNSTGYSENGSSLENPMDNSPGGRDPVEVTDGADGRDSAPDAIPLDLRLKKIAVAFEQNGFGQLNATVKDALVDFLEVYSVEWIIEGMKECALSGKRSIKYLRGILENWQRNGGMTLSSDKKDKPKEEKKPPVKTRFHNFEQRSDNYTAQELEDMAKRKRAGWDEKTDRKRLDGMEALERLKRGGMDEEHK